MYKLLFLFFLITIPLFSCNNENNNSKQTLDSLEKIKQKEKKLIEKQNEYIREQAEKKDVPTDYSNNLKPEYITSFFTKKIPNYETLPFAKGKQTIEDNKIYTFAKAQYEGNNRQSIILDIFDYGKGNIVPNKSVYDDIPSLDGKTTKFKNKYGKGFIEINSKLDYGRLEILIKDRFVVTARLNRNVKDTTQLINLLKYINLKKLSNTK